MENALRTPAAIGITALTSALIVAAPITPTLFDGVVMPPGIRLTSVFDDLTKPYGDLFDHTWTNLEAIGSDRLADPTPLLDQIVTNQSGYWADIWSAVQGGGPEGVLGVFSEAWRTMGQNMLNIATGTTDWSFNLDTSGLIADIHLPPAGDVLAAIGSGDFHDLLQGMINQSLGGINLTMGMPLALTVDALGGPLHFLDSATTVGSGLSQAIDAGDWGAALTTLVTSPATITDATLNAPDFTIGDLLHLLGNLGLAVDNPLDGLGAFTLPLAIAGKSLGTLSLSGLDVSLPISGLLAPLGHAGVEGEIDYTGADICLNVVFGCNGGFGSSPITHIAGDHFPINPHVSGTETGGLVPALVNWLPLELAKMIDGTAAPSWADLGLGVEHLLDPSNWVAGLNDTLGAFGIGDAIDLSWLDTSFLEPLFDWAWLDGLLP